MTKAAGDLSATASTWRRWLDPLHIALVVVIALVAVYLVACIHSGRINLLGPKPLPKPHVVGRFEATIVVLSQDSHEGCVTRAGHRGQLCAGFYSQEPLRLGEKVQMVEAYLPLSQGVVGAVLIVNPTS